ncbi:MAG: hypothetical protein HY774_12155, partial [Acidobacteria bacterium]|nr:hypothetical protein [Acidobacteriota bacterium]
HCLDMFYTVIVTPPNDFRYDDEFNFSEMQSDQVYSDGFIWLAEGPQVLTVEQRLCLGFTTDQQTAAGCTPEVRTLSPDAITRGTTREMTFDGQCFGNDPSRISIKIFLPTGEEAMNREVEVLDHTKRISPNGDQLKVQFSVDTAAPIGTMEMPYTALLTFETGVEFPKYFRVIDKKVTIEPFPGVPLNGIYDVTLKSQQETPTDVFNVEVKIITQSGAGLAEFDNGGSAQEIRFTGNQLRTVRIRGTRVSLRPFDLKLEVREKLLFGQGPEQDSKPFTVIKFIVNQVGFAGGHQLLVWDDSDHPPIPNDGNEPNWERNGNQENSKAAYNYTNTPPVSDQEVKIFAQLTTEPPNIFSFGQIPAKARVVRADAPSTPLGTAKGVQLGVLGTRLPNDTKDPNGFPVRDFFVLDRTRLERSGQGVKAGRYNLLWQVSYEKDSKGEDIWIPFSGRLDSDSAQTGPHIIYWTYRDPKPTPFVDPLSETGIQNNQLFDRALEWGCGLVAGGIDNAQNQSETPIKDLTALLDKITKEVGKSIQLQSTNQTFERHPLEITNFNNRLGGSSNHAVLLSGLLKSIGINAQPVYIWYGKQTIRHLYTYIKDPSRSDGGRKLVTFQVKRPANDNVEENPHFDYFTYVEILEITPKISMFYDPSYGTFDGEPRGEPVLFKFSEFRFHEYMDDQGRLFTNFQTGFNNGLTGIRLPLNTTISQESICEHGENAGFVSQMPNAPLTVKSGQRFQVKITMRNTGGVPWKATSQGFPILEPVQSPDLPPNSWGSSVQSRIPPMILPGRDHTFDFEAVAPKTTTPKEYSFEWQMLDTRSNIEFFGEKTPKILIRVIP